MRYATEWSCRMARAFVATTTTVMAIAATATATATASSSSTATATATATPAFRIGQFSIHSCLQVSIAEAR